MKILARYALAATVATSALVTGCGGGGGDTGGGAGTLRLALTDAPACGYSHVNVTVQKVRVHQSATAGDADAGWSEVVLNPAQRLDLRTLTNGVLAELGQVALPAGHYTQMRLVLAPNDATSPLANAVTPTGGTETPLTIPSGLQTGLKMNINIDVAANKVADFVLDFDACHSVVKLGASGNFNLKPVVTVVPRLSDAGMRVVGYVAPALAGANSSVSVQLNGVVVKSTPPDATGKFVLYPVPAGTYDLVVNAQGRVTATITGVPVTNTAYTYVNANTAAAAIDPPASAEHNAAGTVVVTPVVTPIDATVNVLKKYTGGPTVVVAGGPVDGTTGAFSFLLPGGAAVKTGYVANAAALTFSADSTAPTGKHTLVASAGANTKSVDVDVTSADATATAFTLP